MADIQFDYVHSVLDGGMLSGRYTYSTRSTTLSTSAYEVIWQDMIDPGYTSTWDWCQIRMGIAAAISSYTPARTITSKIEIMPFGGSSWSTLLTSVSATNASNVLYCVDASTSLVDGSTLSGANILPCQVRLSVIGSAADATTIYWGPSCPSPAASSVLVPVLRFWNLL